MNRREFIGAALAGAALGARAAAGVEVTRQLATPLVKGHVHMNYVNLSCPPCRTAWTQPYC